MAIEENYMFIALTETHLSDHSDAEIAIENYNIIRADRTNRKGGGTALYLKRNIIHDEQNTIRFSDNVNELIITTLKQENLIIIVLYRPPDEVNNSTTKLNHIIKIITTYISERNEDILFIGDFNLPKINWESVRPAGRTSNEKAQAEILLTFMNENSMTQLVNEPTRGNNILDLVITNNTKMIHSVQCSPTTISDHNIIFVKFQKLEKNIYKKTRLEKDQPLLKTLNFFNPSIDWEMVNSVFENTDWNEMDEHNSTENKLAFLLEKIESVCSVYIPKRRKSNTKKQCIPKDRKILMRKRTKIRNKIKTNPMLVSELESIENKIILSIKNEKAKKEITALESMKENPKYFFRYAKSKLTRKDRIGPLINSNNEVIDDPVDTANEFIKIFHDAFSSPRQDKIIDDENHFFLDTSEYSDNAILSNIEFSESDIEAAIHKLKSGASPGPDNVPAILLKKCKKALSKPLHKLWKSSFESGSVPQTLKHGLITPIFKKGSKGDATNYRPVILTSHVIKIFERVVAQKITTFMEDHNKFNPHQHGFRRGRSCLSQLLQHHIQTLEGLADGANVDVIYLDYAKAFDKVDHGILAHKIKNIGIHGKLGLWLYNFLKNRTQQVMVDGHCSDTHPVLSGVPQGTVLGPLLFLIMIGDVDKDLQSSTLSSFADDSRLKKKIKEIHDAITLQNDLITVDKWTFENNMNFNYDKFEAIRYAIEEQINYHYTINEAEIEEKDHIKDLGIWLSNDCTFKYHIEQKCKTAIKMTGWLLRTFDTRDPAYLMPLFKSLIISSLEYCCQLWSPHHICDIQQIENVQRMFTRRLIGDNNDYWDRLKLLNIYSLQRRRERYMIIYIWKILEGHVPNPDNQIIQIYNDRRGRRCGRKQLPKTNAGIRTLLDNSIIHLGPKLFNCIPKDTRNLSGCRVETFKKHLDSFLKTVKDEPHITNSPRQRAAQTNSLPDQLLAAATEASHSKRPTNRPSTHLHESTKSSEGGDFVMARTNCV